jgi:hypothetical protein
MIEVNGDFKTGAYCDGDNDDNNGTLWKTV